MTLPTHMREKSGLYTITGSAGWRFRFTEGLFSAATRNHGGGQEQGAFERREKGREKEDVSRTYFISDIAGRLVLAKSFSPGRRFARCFRLCWIFARSTRATRAYILSRITPHCHVIFFKYDIITVTSCVPLIIVTRIKN